MALSVKLVDGSDPAAIETYCQVTAAVREHDVPKWRETTPAMLQRMVEVPFPGTAQEFYLVWRDGQPVGRVLLEIPMRENLDMLVPDIWVVPSARRQGIGRELFDWVKAFAGTRQRKRLICTTLWELPGIPAPNLAGAAFAEALGFRGALADVTRRLDLSTVDESVLDEMLAAAKAKSADYRVVTWSGSAPEEYIDDLAYLDSRLMTDAPMGELEFEAPKPDAQRIRDFQRASAARERATYHAAAVHEQTDRLVAWTTITKELSLDWNAFQQITIVEPEHRGHRLGALVKVENLRHFRANEPTVTAIDTFNANDNSYMIAINEQMGFRPLYAWQNWQREI
ncbi:MAG TPA: GNAT family N-acetyltransferase [Micromonosporaceae bacterium]|nr:GNAT family N-acetyltransferase [Micromonosporaceae bacterium]